jgi:hypothetical protein
MAVGTLVISAYSLALSPAAVTSAGFKYKRRLREEETPSLEPAQGYDTVLPSQGYRTSQGGRCQYLDCRLCDLVVRVPGYRSRVRFPALADFLSSSGSGTGAN